MTKLLQKNNKLVVVAIVMALVFGIRSFGQQGRPPAEPPKNLTVLPKNTSGDDVRKIMKTYSRSLGVHCDFCHVGVPQEGKPFPKMDFASDDKPEKNIARKMMAMVDSININFINKMGESDFEQITCVTCHMGHSKPMVSVDSLMTK